MLYYFVCFVFTVSISTAEQVQSSLRFIVLGDWGGLPNYPYHTPVEEAVAKQMANVSSAYDIQLLLALGDNFYFDGVANDTDPRFKETYERVFRAKDLRKPWYFVAGNHDHNGNVSAQIAFSKRFSSWRFPELYYKLELSIGDVRVDIVMIDTVVLCGNSDDRESGAPLGPARDDVVAEKQWRWIEKTLAFSTAHYLLVAGHYPVYSVAEHGPTPLLVQRLRPLLRKYRVTSYLSGHDHNLQHLAEGSHDHLMHYFVSGAANFIDLSRKHESNVPSGSLRFIWNDIFELGGFGLVRVTSSDMTWTFIQASGKHLYEVKLFPRANDWIERLVYEPTQYYFNTYRLRL